MSFLTALTRGMTTERWMRIPASMVPVDSLVPTQTVAADLWVTRRQHPAACADPLIHVVAIGDVLFVEDGHHRLARARRDGLKHVHARVLHVCLSEPPPADDDAIIEGYGT